MKVLPILAIIVVLFGLPLLYLLLGALLVVLIDALLHIAHRASIVRVIVELFNFGSFDSFTRS